MKTVRQSHKRDHVVATEHKHVWRLAYTRGDRSVGDRCECGAERERPPTKAEKRKFALEGKRGRAIHARWHELARRFKTGRSEWKMQGWDLIEALEKYTATRPEIRTVRVDDSSFSNSDLIFIPHSYDSKKLGCAYMGTTALFIAQCAGDPPVEFFLYPNHLRNLITTLQAIEKQQDEMRAKARKQGAFSP